jgi:hypothetical protein
MVPSWRLEALHCICATGYHEISLTLRARAQRQRPNCVPLNLSEAHPPVRQPLISFQSRCLKRAYPVCFARGKRSSEGNADEDGNPKAKNDSGADSSTDSPSSSSFGGGSNWNNWGFGFGIGKSDKSDLAEEERERKIRQEEWERWQRSWSEVLSRMQPIVVLPSTIYCQSLLSYLQPHRPELIMLSTTSDCNTYPVYLQLVFDAISAITKRLSLTVI